MIGVATPPVWLWSPSEILRANRAAGSLCFLPGPDDRNGSDCKCIAGPGPFHKVGGGESGKVPTVAQDCGAQAQQHKDSREGYGNFHWLSGHSALMVSNQSSLAGIRKS